MTGGVLSVMVNVAVVVLAFPHPSVAVNVTVVAPHEVVRVVKLLVQVTVPQLSVATALA